VLKALNDNAGAIQVIFAALVTLATLVYAGLTWSLVTETRRMRRAQTDAKMVIGLDVREEQINLVELFVRNEGVGSASDIRFDVEMLGSTGHSEILESILSLGFIDQGLAYFSPGQEIRSFLTSMAIEFEAKLSTKIQVTITYSTASGERASDTYVLDLAVFKGRHQLGEPDLHSVAKSLKSLAKDVDHLASGFHKLQVITQDKAEYRREQEEALDALREERRETLAGEQAETETGDEA
jgi:hypothetical protein